MSPLTFTNAPPRWTAPLILAAFALSGIGAGASFGLPAGLAVAAVGPALLAAIAAFRTEVTMVFDDRGATVRRRSRRTGRSERRFAWHEVERAARSTRTVSAGDSQTTIDTFVVIVGGERVLEVTSQMRDFAPIVLAVNAQLAGMPAVPVGTGAGNHTLLAPATQQE